MKKKRYNHKPSIKCLECGRKFVRPMSHVWQVHGLSAYDYKKLHGLDTKRGIATEEYRQVMRDLLKPEVVENLTKAGQKSRFKKGDKTLGTYKRSEQTQERLKKHWIEDVVPKSWEGKKKRAVRITKTCDICGKPVTRNENYFLVYNQKHVYCSRSCSTTGKNLKL